MLKFLRDDAARLRSITQWSALRVVGNSRLLQASMVVPVLGYLILFSDQFMGWISSSALAAVDMKGSGEHTLSRLYYLYFGLTVTGIASFIYQGFCPTVIKVYRDADEYVLIGRTSMSAVDFERLSAETGIRAHLNTFDSKIDDHQIRVMKMYYLKEDERLTIPRSVALLLYSIGFFILAIPSVLGFIDVVKAFSKQI